MTDTPPQRDFFLAHATADVEAAERLFALLPPGSAFLATRCVELGDLWPKVIPDAQKASLITVVLLSKRSDAAFYAGEEIQTAVALFRREQGWRRIAPVYLEDGVDPPYGLRQVHSVTLRSLDELPTVADRLQSLARRLRAWQSDHVEPTQGALEALTSAKVTPRHVGVIAGSLRPALLTIGVLFGLVVAAVVVVAIVPVEAVTRRLTLLFLAVTAFALLGLLALLVVRSLDTARGVAMSGVPHVG